ncbi:hypothetical protein IFM89_015876 [Coptis chinensis]|uniref:40S ribosomal protein S19 n=1 Tax=Coptis chinensis TaxID=261450 RepID=A0A835MBM0_9MAGN|nr:hypothetical protein IFM89_015876 [Coptis chinensis]
MAVGLSFSDYEGIGFCGYEKMGFSRDQNRTISLVWRAVGGGGGEERAAGERERRKKKTCCGAIARNILHRLQDMKIVNVDPKGGRVITSTGRRDLDQVARRIVVPGFLLLLHDWNLSFFYILSFVEGFVGPF